MDPFQQLVYSQRPDVQGHPVNDWWTLWGANELRNKLTELGRTDVLQHAGNNNEILKAWYQLWGSKEYPNIWQAGGTQAAVPQTPISEQYSKVGAEQAPTIPQWENVLPYENLKSQFDPYFKGAAEQYVGPEVQRQYQTNLRDYMNSLASMGGGRFGRGIGGTGSLAASANRSLQEQMLDYQNQFGNALQQWYSGTGSAYSKARDAGDVYDFKMPTYSDFTGGLEAPGGGLSSQYKQSTKFNTPIF